MDRGKSRVPGPGAAAALVLEVVQERCDKGCVEVVEVQHRGRGSGARGGEGQQHPPRVAVAGDGLRAGVALPGQPVGEERL
jgi:hypothetical protein